MPRVTRAALRTRELQEESDIAASTPLPPTPIKKRVPLGEISDNVATEVQAAELEEKLVPAKKGPGRGKKGNAAKKANKQRKVKAMDIESEIAEDDNESATSSAVEEACQDLLKDSSETTQVLADEEQTLSPPSEAVKVANQHLSPKFTPPQVHIEMQKPIVATISPTNTAEKDPVAPNPESSTPTKMTSASQLNDQSGNDGSKEDSFLEQIKTRSPGKRVSRIEDYVEALDVLEEEIEKVDKLIPTTTDNLSDTTKPKKQSKALPKTGEKKVNGSVRIKNNTNAPVKPVTSKPSPGVRSVALRPSIQPTVRTTSSPLKASQTKPAVTSTSPASTGELARGGPLPTKHKRVSSIHKAPFQPAKSTKPSTQPIFELPGEAISRRLKEQREERQKREEEAKTKQRVFKARPVRLSQAPEVKLTAAAKARIDLAKGEAVTTAKPTNGTPNPKTAPRATPTTSTGTKKRISSLSTAKRTSAVQPTASSSVRITRKPSLTTASVVGNPSGSTAPRAAPTAEDLALQKVKGKEVFGRTKAEITEREKARKEKEEAAKKARAEAAERGRIASREWAEKQKLRKMEAQKANGDSKVVGA